MVGVGGWPAGKGVLVVEVTRCYDVRFALGRWCAEFLVFILTALLQI